MEERREDATTLKTPCKAGILIATPFSKEKRPDGDELRSIGFPIPF